MYNYYESIKEPVVSDDLRWRKLDTQSDTTTGLEI